jgi:hypothetical protein
MLRMRRLISNRKLLINPSNGVLPTNPLACGFVEFVIEKSVVHMSWRGHGLRVSSNRRDPVGDGPVPVIAHVSDV